jgi:hypothetical protein
MKKALLTFLFFIFGYAFAQPPDWVWAKSTGSVSNDYSNATCTDANGNVYITGTFQGSTITFGSYTLQNTATGSLDIFIVKYDSDGNVLWAESGGGTGNDYSYGVCSDVNGNIYIAGYYRSPTITFGAMTLANSDTITMSTDVFVVKYDFIGNFLWARSCSGTGNYPDADVWGIRADVNNNVYITGQFGGSSVIFGSDTLTRIGGGNVYITKYDSNGNVMWAKKIWGDQVYGYAICVDANANIYVGGIYYNHAIFGIGDSLHNSSWCYFLAKYDTNGNKLWSKGTNSGGVSGITCITADTIGNIYLGGYFRYSIISGDTLGNAGNISIFISKYDSSGNPIWAKTPGGTGDDFGVSICRATTGSIFMTGYFTSSFLNFGGIPVVNTNAGYNEVFIAQYDANGNALWAKGIGGQDHDYGMGITANASGDIYLTGYFGSYSLNFGSNMVTNNGSYDVYLAKLSTPTAINDLSTFNSQLSIYPNPAHNTFTISFNGQSSMANGQLSIFDVTGRVLHEQVLNQQSTIINQQLRSGIYFVRVTAGERVFTEKLVVE